jgi:hypothetical protein
MSGHPLDDLPTLRDFRDQLVAVGRAEAAAPARRRRSPRHARAPHRRLSLVLAAALALLVAGSAAAALLAGLRATVIPGPRAGDVARPETIVASSARVLRDVRAHDPDGHTIWTLRTARTRAGETCLTVGQPGPGGGFGLVGLDGRFRTLAPSFADACGETKVGGPDAPILVGARTLAAERRAGVRTVIYGMAQRLSEVTISVAGQRTRTITPSRDHAFAFVMAGYPEDHPVRVDLIRNEAMDVVRTFGTSPRLVAATGGALPALKVDSFFVDSAPHTGCLHVTAARHVPGAGEGPTICGSAKPATPFGAVRAVKPGKHKSYDWGSFPARTLAVGSWPRPLPRLRSVVLHAPTGTVRARILGGRRFLGVLPARVRPRDVTVTVTPQDGPPVTFRGSLHLVPNPMTR